MRYPGWLATAFAATLTMPAVADEGGAPNQAATHAPIGVMGDHMHDTGEVMLSYRFMHMDMGGNRIGNHGVDADTIATTVPNRFFGMPNQPPTLRIVPTSMSMDMHMFGAMYAPTDWLTLMAMGMYVDKEMKHTTYMGGMGTAQLGTFNVHTAGLGDTRLSGLIRLHDDGRHHVHLNAGISAPTGATGREREVLTPMDTRPTLRVPYAMQPGSGTWDLLPGITYTGRSDQWFWGAQYQGTFRTGHDNGYSLGDNQMFTGWLSYQWMPAVSTSVRLQYDSAGNIDGIDPMIMGPVQTADPDNYGGDTLSLLLGFNLIGQDGALAGHRLAVEAGLPLRRDLNGPQMETDWTATVGWQYAFE
jgi:hypothetical protein